MPSTISYDLARRLGEQAGSPFYLFHQETFEANYARLLAAFEARYQPVMIGYSYKTNYVPYLGGIIRDRGGWAEVVSRMEYDLALRIGQDPRKIIFNGPVKRREDIHQALASGSLVNLDAPFEIPHVLSFAQGHPQQRIEIGLRINMHLTDSAGMSHIQSDLPVSRFGFSAADDSVARALQTLREAPNVAVVSLHGHTSTTDRSVWCYQTIARTLCDVAQQHRLETLRYLNVGGGFFGDVPTAMQWKPVPGFGDYAEAVGAVLNGRPWIAQVRPTLVLEPGVAVVANAMSYVAHVMGLKRIGGKLLAVVDGSVMHTKPTRHKRNAPFEVIAASPGAAETQFSVVGATCMETDYLLDGVCGAEPRPGDYLCLHQVGGYTVSMSPTFIDFAPAIVALSNGQTRLIRRRQSLNTLLADYEIP